MPFHYHSCHYDAERFAQVSAHRVRWRCGGPVSQPSLFSPPPPLPRPFGLTRDHSAGVLSNASGSLLIKPCKVAEIEFYQSALHHPQFAYYIPVFMGNISFVGKSGPDVAAMMESINPDQQHSAIHQIPDEMVREKAWAPSGGGKIRTDSGVVLENITANYRKFNVLDVKLGARLWADDAPQAKREKMENEANSTTSKALGIRIAGMRIYTGRDPAGPQGGDAEDDGIDQDTFGQIDPNGSDYRIYDKHYGRSLTVDTVHKGFEKFFRIAPGKAPDEDIKKVLRAFLTDLDGLRCVLESEECRIYSSSLLFVYEGDREALHEAIQLEENSPNIAYVDAAVTSPEPIKPTEKPPHDESTPPERETLTKDTMPESESLSSDDAAEPYEADDKDSDSESPQLRIQALKLIDFAHAQWTKGQGPDENLLYGIKNVIKILSEIINR